MSQYVYFAYINTYIHTLNTGNLPRSLVHTQEGEALITEYLQQVKALPVPEMSDEELAREMERLKESVLSHKNAYIQALLSN